MSLGLGLFRHRSSWPATQKPAWAEKVERWYQLDPAAYVMADAYWSYRTELQTPPHWLILASPAASNYTDAQFAANPTPAKFVHTLPNTRGCSLLQLMNWTGQVLCLQKDPSTVLFALGEAFRLSELEQKPVWVASAREAEEGWFAEIYCVGKEGQLAVRTSSDSSLTTRDDEWFKWLEGPDRKLVAEGYEIIKK